MTDTEILEDIKKIIHKHFGIDQDKIEEESYLDSDLNITDIEIDDLIVILQEKYDIKFPKNSSLSFKKVSDLVTFIFENADSTN